MRTGTANLPLHGGRCPAWLFAEMKELGSAIVQAVAYEYGPAEVLARLSDPFWFQALGCVLGFDWHSSGVTTTVCGALKEGLKPHQGELGIFMAGGKGRTSRKTPQEIEEAGEKFGLTGSPDSLKYASRMAAKIDNNALQDGFQIYHHFFVFTRDGKWAVIQQGLNEGLKYARRYHWLSDRVASFVCEPHSAVTCDITSPSLNLVAGESETSRRIITLLSHENPDKTLGQLNKINSRCRPQPASPLPESTYPLNGQMEFQWPEITGRTPQPERTLSLPSHHYVPKSAQIKRALENAYMRQPESFEDLVGLPGVGSAALRALSLVAEIIHGVKPSYRDPVRYSFAHGGKDGHPFPVDQQAYRASVECLEKALEKAKLGDTAKIKAFRKLAQLYQAIK